MKGKLHIIIALLITVCSSCVEVMDDFELNTAAPRIVVEATISQEKATVILSKTTSYLNPSNVPYISDAKVTVAFNDTILTLKEDSTGFYSIKYSFPMETKYHLAVTIGDTFISGETYMPKTVKWDSVVVRLSEFSEMYHQIDSTADLYDVLVYVTDPKNEQNYYRVETYENDTMKSSSVTDDGYFDGQNVQLVTMLGVYEVGDKLMMYLKSIDKPAYEFYNTLALSNSSTGMFSAPDNPKSNLVGGALGRFYAYSVDSIGVVFE
ncbi:MAG: DUF4249 domain-containing protein [Bacteroidales bacterium]|nr:DUF4249 domain-containing protein [Bacteroidales bacterium]